MFGISSPSSYSSQSRDGKGNTLFVKDLSPREYGELLEVKFDEVAVWARALNGQERFEWGRGVLDFFTLGLFEISRVTAGNAYHWACIVRGKDKNGHYVYYIVQFGNGERNDEKRPEVHGGLAWDTCAAESLVAGDKSKPVWIKKPKTSYGKSPSSSSSDWTSTKSRTVNELFTFIDQAPQLNRPYRFDGNNCQHFAGYMYKQL